MARSALRTTGAVLVVTACALAAGCSSAPKRTPRPPHLVVPGVAGPAGPAGPAGAGARAAAAGGSARAGTRGVVLLGGWAPGGRRDPVAAGSLAYFRWLNARGGVYGRRIDYRVLNDRGNARLVPSLAHRLVQGDAVFAVFGSAGAPGAPTAGFLHLSGVPDVFSGTGCACVNEAGRLPEVFGWPVEGRLEGSILGTYLAQHDRGDRAVVIYTADRQERAELAGFTAAASGIKLAATEPVAGVADAEVAVASAKKARAGLVVVLSPADVTVAVAKAMTAAHLHAPLVAADSGIAAGLPDGTITDSFLPSPASPPKSAAASWMALFRKIRAKYLRGYPLSAALIDGMSQAYEMAAALFRAGSQLTRQGLVAALNGLLPGPSAAPLAFSPTDHGGAEGAYMGTIRAGVIVPASGVLIASSTSPRLVTAYAFPQQTAPVNGIPAP